MIFDVNHELPGWELLWLKLRLRPGQPAEVAALADLREEVAAVARANFEGDSLSSDPVVAGVRALFRAAGCDPTRYRPSSEALLRRLLKGEELAEADLEEIMGVIRDLDALQVEARDGGQPLYPLQMVAE